MNDLNEVFEAIQKKAVERGLSLVHGVPVLFNCPVATWKGEWTAYLDLAGHVKTALVYAAAKHFDLEQETAELASEMSLEQIRRIRTGTEVNEIAWFSQWLMEYTSEWGKYNQQINRIECFWFKEGVGHQFQLEAAWYRAYQDSVDKAIEEAESVEPDHRQVQTKEEAVKTLQLAEQLARHQRFPEASNSDKRLFMAEKLFPNCAEEGLDLHRIVRLAEMIYWWDVEPVERATKAQKVHDLRGSGESIRNIAALLKMSEAKVRATIEAADE